MPKRSSIPDPDENEVTARIVDEATTKDGKNPAAVELGRLGGLRGGKARADKLSKQRRREIARQAAQARWTNRPQQQPRRPQNR